MKNEVNLRVLVRKQTYMCSWFHKSKELMEFYSIAYGFGIAKMSIHIFISFHQFFSLSWNIIRELSNKKENERFQIKKKMSEKIIKCVVKRMNHAKKYKKNIKKNKLIAF